MRLTIDLLLLVLLAAILNGGAATAAPTENETTFKTGQVWLDTGGKPIQSHLGGVLYDRGTYYWYGMNFSGTTLAPGTISKSQHYSWMRDVTVSVYSSPDLYNWKPAGDALSHEGLPADSMLIRPKVIRNGKTGKYVMMAALTSPDFTANDIVVATSDNPTGQFTVSSIFTPPGGAFDMTLYNDDDGKAYLITAANWIKVSELSDDYLSIKTTTTVSGVAGEAPAIFKSHGVYYFLTSQTTGWAPNANHYSTAASITGPWTYKGEFATGDGAYNTFGSQTTFVLPVAGRQDSFIYMADRTNATSTTTIADLGAMTHVWLPISLDAAAGTMTVPWRSNWDLSVFPSPAPEPSTARLTILGLLGVLCYGGRGLRDRGLQGVRTILYHCLGR